MKNFAEINAAGLPQLLGIEVDFVRQGAAQLSFEISEKHFAPNGYLHAGSIVSLADTACGYGCIASLPEGAANFTTLELKSNHMASAKAGRLVASASLLHGGKTTQIWDASVSVDGKLLAQFRATQLILYPR